MRGHKKKLACMLGGGGWRAKLDVFFIYVRNKKIKKQKKDTPAGRSENVRRNQRLQAKACDASIVRAARVAYALVENTPC